MSGLLRGRISEEITQSNTLSPRGSGVFLSLVEEVRGG